MVNATPSRPSGPTATNSSSTHHVITSSTPPLSGSAGASMSHPSSGQSSSQGQGSAVSPATAAAGGGGGYHPTKPKRRLSNRVSSTPASPSHHSSSGYRADSSTGHTTASSFIPTSPSHAFAQPSTTPSTWMMNGDGDDELAGSHALSMNRSRSSSNTQSRQNRSQAINGWHSNGYASNPQPSTISEESRRSSNSSSDKNSDFNDANRPILSMATKKLQALPPSGLQMPSSRSPSAAWPSGAPQPQQDTSAPMKLWGIELKWISLITLALQNAFLTIIMHYSRVSTSPSKAYSAASAVLMNELLKGSISFAIAFRRTDEALTRQEAHLLSPGASLKARSARTPESSPLAGVFKINRWQKLSSEIFSPDCWKLSIPAVLYVIQNNLQYVAASNLDVATFQVTYQMKILTTAFFSVILLGKRLSTPKWLSLLLLAIGVGIVQIQSGKAVPTTPKVVKHTALRSDIPSMDQAHQMSPLKGFSAVSAACMTSGLAGVYFEMVLKGSQADLWTRNIQLSLFSLLPAVIPIVWDGSFVSIIQGFANFNIWAWATVLTQVFGGLVTAVVIKYSDNILKGFATSLSIVISFLASVGLFAYPITPAFVLGAIVVLGATWMYNQPAKPATPAKSRVSVAVPGSPIGGNAPIIGETPKPSRTSSMVSLLGLAKEGMSRSTTPSGFRAGSPAPSGFFTAPSTPHLGPSLSHQSSSTSLHHLALSSSGPGTSRNNSMGNLYKARPVLEVNTSR